jgi:hypothetical protein
MVGRVMVALCMSTQDDFAKGVAIFGEVKGKGQMGERRAVRGLRFAIKEVQDLDEIDYPNAKSKCGAIFARLVKDNVIKLSFFGDASGIPFSWEFFEGFLNECWTLGMQNILKSSRYMKDMRFRPRLFSHNQFLHVMDDTGMLDCWPVYEAMADTYYAMRSGKPQEELREIIHGFGAAIVNSVDFVEFSAEFFVIHKPADYVDIFAELIEKKFNDALRHLERVGEYLRWSLDDLAEEIRGLADFLEIRDLTSWSRSEGGSEKIHAQLCEIVLKRKDL